MMRLRVLKAIGGSGCHIANALPEFVPASHVARNLFTSAHLLQEPAKSEKEQPQSSGSESQESQASSSAESEQPGSQQSEQKSRFSYEDIKSRFTSGTSSSSSGNGQKARAALSSVMDEVKQTLSSTGNLRSVTRKYEGPVMEVDAAYDGPSSLAIVKEKETAWKRSIRMVREKLGFIPFVKNLETFDVKDTSAFRKGQELVDDMKEKYETSDHPMVHKVEDVKERLFSQESEVTRGMSELLSRDPEFDLNFFLQCVKLDVHDVVSALLNQDLERLRQHCSQGQIERLAAIFKYKTDQDQFDDPTILFIGEVDLVEMRMAEGDPCIIVRFDCQQLNCKRNKAGEIVDGSADSIQKVFYFWALQQEKHGVVTAEGKVLAPRWVITEMAWHPMLALV